MELASLCTSAHYAQRLENARLILADLYVYVGRDWSVQEGAPSPNYASSSMRSMR